MPNQDNNGHDHNGDAGTNNGQAASDFDKLNHAFAGRENQDEFLGQAEDLKDLLQQIAIQIADVDKRHSNSLRDMHERLAVIGERAQQVSCDVPEEFQPAFERINDAVSLLADRVSMADQQRLARQETSSEIASNDEQSDIVEPKDDADLSQAKVFSSQLEQELQELKSTLSQSKDQSESDLDAAAPTTEPDEARAQTPISNPPQEPSPAQTAVSSIACDPAQPWDADAVSALADLYASGEDGLPPTRLRDPDQVDEEASEIQGLQATHIDQTWLEARFADVAARVEMSLADVQEKFSLEDLGSRFDQLEDRMAVALEEAVSRPNADGLAMIEEQLGELTNHLQSTQTQLARLDSIEDQIGEVIRQMSSQGEMANGIEAAPSQTDIHAIAETVASQFADTLADKQPRDQSAQQISGLQTLLEGYIVERREGEKNTSGALDTMQSALIHLLERVDAMELNLAEPAAPSRTTADNAESVYISAGTAAPDLMTEPVFGAPKQPTPQEYGREAVRFNTDDEPLMRAQLESSNHTDTGRAADEARYLADAASEAAGNHQAPRGTLPKSPGGNDSSASVLTADKEFSHRPADVLRSSATAKKAAQSETAKGGSSTTSQGSNEKADFIAQARRAQKLAGERMEEAESEAKLLVAETGLRSRLKTPASMPDASAMKGAIKKGGKAMPKSLLLACAGLAVVTMATLLYGKFSGTSHQSAEFSSQIRAPRDTAAGKKAKINLKARASDSMAQPAGAAPAAASASRPAQAGDFSDGQPDRPMPGKLTEDSSLMPNQIPLNAAPAGITVHKSSRKLSAAAMQRIIDGQARAEMSSRIAQRGGPSGVSSNISLQPQTGLAGGVLQGGITGRQTNFNNQLNMPPALIGPLSLRLAAAKGDPSAEFEVAARFAGGKGIKQDYSEAVKWYKRSAARGFAPAQYRLGTFYERGMGVSTDLSRSRIWYLRAAKQGNVKAMHNLAVLSAGRVSGSPDYASAVQWFTEAGERGLADSQFNLGILYNSGLGVTANPVQSYKWFSLAAARGDKQAAVRADALRSKLTPAQMTSAERLVRSWRQTPVERLVNDPHAAGRAWTSSSRGAPSAG